MRNNKIKISALQIKSFVTNLKSDVSNNLKGGTGQVCIETQIEELCGGLSCPSYYYITQHEEHVCK